MSSSGIRIAHSDSLPAKGVRESIAGWDKEKASRQVRRQGRKMPTDLAANN
jgi:hypothetical protein